mgnify:CR=1 FL=1
MTWKDMAKEVWKAREILEAQFACEKSMKQMELLINAVKRLVVFDEDSKIKTRFIDDEATLVVDDVQFVLANGSGGLFSVAIKGKCPKCGEVVSSWPIPDLKHLGKYLEKFEPCGGHTSFCHRIRRD